MSARVTKAAATIALGMTLCACASSPKYACGVPDGIGCKPVRAVYQASLAGVPAIDAKTQPTAGAPPASKDAAKTRTSRCRRARRSAAVAAASPARVDRALGRRRRRSRGRVDAVSASRPRLLGTLAMNLWNTITQEARRWFNEELPGGLYAAGGMPPSVHATKALADVHRLSDLLPYETYDPEQGLFCNDDAVGFVIEITPATGLDDNQLRVLSGLFTQVMLPKTLLQISLYASPDISPVLERWQSLRAQANPAFQFLAARRIDYLRTGNWQSLLSDQPMLLRNFRVFLTVSRPFMRTHTGGIGDVGWLQRLREAIKGMLASASLGVRDVDAQGFINLLDTILNPARERRMPIAWNESRLLREQMVDPDTLLLVGRDGLALSHRGFSVDVLPFSVRQYPQAWSGHGMINLIGDLYSNTLRIPCPFLYTLDRADGRPGGSEPPGQDEGGARHADDRFADGAFHSRVEGAQAGLGLRHAHAGGRSPAAEIQLPDRSVRAPGRGGSRGAATHRGVQRQGLDDRARPLHHAAFPTHRVAVDHRPAQRRRTQGVRPAAHRRDLELRQHRLRSSASGRAPARRC